MSHLVTKPAPDFKAKAVMPDGSVRDISLSEYKGQYVFLYFFPLAFTFVCPTEILAFDKRIKDFQARGCTLLGVSVDSHHTLSAWRDTPVKQGGIGPIKHAVVADLSKAITRSYGILLDEEVALRGLYLIDKQGVVRHALVNDLPLGRSVDEAIRTLDALQHYEENGEVCPADWHKGDEAMTESKESVSSYLGRHAA
jgi:peroxiredoxin (alkyl hydroperoxide reductase subunit C)